MNHYAWRCLGHTDYELGLTEEMHLAMENWKRLKRGENTESLMLETDSPALPPPD